MNSTTMRIGLGLPQVGVFADPGCTRRVAVAAELGGFDSLWTVDRVLTPASAPAERAGVLDPLLTLTLADGSLRRPSSTTTPTTKAA